MFWHKLTHWEFWPAYIVYFPTFCLWVYYSLILKNIKFFRFANPKINNGGLYGDSKFEIYQHLPKDSYPKTILIKKNDDINISQLISEHSLEFPLIVKPDVGCRGFMVQKVNNLNEIKSYRKNLNKDFLIQELVKFPHEIGLFYQRYPNKKAGKVTGITFKKFLMVKGDGEKSIKELLNSNPRHSFQIQKLSQTLNLDEILLFGEERIIVPYGNHCRGTEFLDYSHKINPKLEEMINRLLSGIDGFYFGRLDIRFNTFEELEDGINFSIIEFNGAKSEPSHIYDPKHNFWYAQKEIFKHNKILFETVKIGMSQLKM
ncbi:MAG: hypothetical protein SNJ77_10460 [Cytophagales bacterium]